MIWNKNEFKVIGMMSGTSLDGLDIAFCRFHKKKSGWEYQIEDAVTKPYSSAWTSRIGQAHLLSSEKLLALDADFGKYLGKACADFINKHKIKADFISSHGHTIFHQPENGFTYQIGNGNALHTEVKIPVVFDFRSLDVMLGGEGAPLVPAGDKFLFKEFDVCLNLGGIANLSRDIKGKRVAYDICFCNMGLNYLASKAGKEFDRNGQMASEGNLNRPLLKELSKIYDTIRKKRPSIGRELFENKIMPLLDDEKIPLADKLHTSVESSAIEISKSILSEKIYPKVLCTGGGVFNSFMISRILEHCGDDATLIIPEEKIAKFKEAMVFAFLGVLRVTGSINCLKSVTRASRDNSGGVMVGF